jgi:hypothetical protein
VKRLAVSLTKTFLPLGLAIGLAAGACLPAHLHAATLAAGTATLADTPSSEAEFRALARDVYLYAYPLVIMDLTMRQATNVADASSVPRRAPLNQFAHFRAYPGAGDKEVVRFNFDTLYSFAWIDTRMEPVILSIPDSQGRYFLAPLLDMWTDVFAVPGTRTTEGKPGHYAITAPGWRGELPTDVERIEAPTSMAWLMTRTQTNGPADYANVHQFQDGLQLTPLSQWGKPYSPPVGQPVRQDVDNRTPPLQQVNAMDGVQLLSRFAELLQSYPPHANDYPILHRMRALGLEPGKDFDTGRFNPAQLQVLRGIAKQSQQELYQLIVTSAVGKAKNGWNWSDNLGTYGTDYRRRAIVALAGLGANLPEDAIYPSSPVDAEGQPYSGENAYVLRFEAGQLPPAEAFWSLTMYDHEGFQVGNPINRFALGSHDALKYGADGSLELYLQHRSPGQDKASNWLPAPKGNFQIMLRLYSPKPVVMSNTWAPPAVKRVN